MLPRFMAGGFIFSFFRTFYPTVALLILVAVDVARAADTVFLPAHTSGKIGAPREPDVKRAPVMLGIDVLEAEGFAALKGKRIGLLTHPAGVNRGGISTIDVLRHAPGFKLVALFAVEHGLHNDLPAEVAFQDSMDPVSNLKIISLYKGRVLKPTSAQLKSIDALVIDLQDIGARTYTFSGAMKTAMEACWENGKEVIVLDRPNPLGGLKVDGPPLDEDQMSDVGRFRVPYVHGLTIGELARMAADPLVSGGMTLSDEARARGKLTVISMRGWNRSMRWPETGLAWIPTSGLIPDFEAVQGYAMTGPGCILGGFRHGVGPHHPFRGIAHPSVNKVPLVVLEKELRALRLPGLQFRTVRIAGKKPGQSAHGIYIDITDYEAWNPTELSFHLMKLACKLEPRNPFATASLKQRRTFLVHIGSAEFLADLTKKGEEIEIKTWLNIWREQAKIYQAQSRKYWLYQ